MPGFAVRTWGSGRSGSFTSAADDKEKADGDRLMKAQAAPSDFKDQAGGGGPTIVAELY